MLERATKKREKMDWTKVHGDADALFHQFADNGLSLPSVDPNWIEVQRVFGVR